MRVLAWLGVVAFVIVVSTVIVCLQDIEKD
jgi:hypothetical protein